MGAIRDEVDASPVKWRNKIPKEPTKKEFDEGWDFMEQCDFLPSDAPIDIKLKYYSYLDYTDNPILMDYEDHFFSGSGTSWNIDDNGTRYLYLSRDTGLPIYWEAIKFTGIVNNFLIQQYKRKLNDDTKLLLFGKWLPMNYSNDEMNSSDGDWWITTLEHFNTVVFPNYLDNGSVKSHYDYLKRIK